MRQIRSSPKCCTTKTKNSFKFSPNSGESRKPGIPVSLAENPRHISESHQRLGYCSFDKLGVLQHVIEIESDRSKICARSTLCRRESFRVLC